jgi:hypothetical protein
MSDIMEWRPFREVSRLRREMDRLWDDYFGPGRRACLEKFRVSSFKFQVRGAGLRARLSRVRTAHQ